MSVDGVNVITGETASPGQSGYVIDARGGSSALYSQLAVLYYAGHGVFAQSRLRLVPVDVDLGLAKYVNKRGVKGLMFQPDQEFKDPFGIQNMLTPPASLGLSAGPAPASKP